MSADPLKDDLGLELERLAAIEPSPALAARVRERVAGERVAPRWLRGWQLASVAAAIAALSTVVLVPDGERLTPPLPVLPPSSAPAISVPVLPLDTAITLSFATPPRKTASPRVHSELAPAPLEPLPQISIEPVAIEPLAAIAPLSGERQ